MLPSYRKYFKTIYMFVYFYTAQEVELHLFRVSFSTSTSSIQSTTCITIKQNNLKFSMLVYLIMCIHVFHCIGKC